MSKRQERIARAKERDPIETEKLRLRERAKIPSKVARFLPRYTKREIALIKAHDFADVKGEEDIDKAIDKEILKDSIESGEVVRS